MDGAPRVRTFQVNDHSMVVVTKRTNPHVSTQRVETKVSPLIPTSNDLLIEFALPIPAALVSVNLEVLAPKEEPAVFNLWLMLKFFGFLCQERMQKQFSSCQE